METSVIGRLRILALLSIWLLQVAVPGAVASYSIGVGRADTTGPTAEVVFVSTSMFNSNLFLSPLKPFLLF